MTKGGEGLSEAMLVPAGVSAWAKEVGSLVIVDAVDFFATGGKERNHFGSDQARGAGYEELHDCYLCGRWDGEGKGIFGPALLGLGRLAELGPLGPAPAHPRHSLRDGLTFRFRGGIRRAGGVEGRTAKGRPDRSPDRVGADRAI